MRRKTYILLWTSAVCVSPSLKKQQSGGSWVQKQSSDPSSSLRPRFNIAHGFLATLGLSFLIRKWRHQLRRILVKIPKIYGPQMGAQ